MKMINSYKTMNKNRQNLINKKNDSKKIAPASRWELLGRSQGALLKGCMHRCGLERLEPMGGRDGLGPLETNEVYKATGTSQEIKKEHNFLLNNSKQ